MLLAFAVFLVWDQFNGAQKNADIESILARALYRDVRYYPDSAATKDTRKALVSYTRSEVVEEYPLISKQQDSPKTVRLFSNGFRQDAFTALVILNQELFVTDEIFTGQIHNYLYVVLFAGYFCVL